MRTYALPRGRGEGSLGSLRDASDGGAGAVLADDDDLLGSLSVGRSLGRILCDLQCDKVRVQPGAVRNLVSEGNLLC